MPAYPAPADAAIHEVTIDDVAFQGDAIARVNGEVVFVPGAITGERVRIAIERHRKGFAQGRILQVLEPSPHRVTPPCAYVGSCSGCTWQHIAYEEQLRLKQHIVAEQLRRIGKLTSVTVLPTIGMENPWGYRNHARFSVRRGGQLGFMTRQSHHFVRIDRCLIMAEPINQVLAHFQERGVPSTAFNVRVGIATGDLMIQPVIADQRYATGQPSLRERLLGREFVISGPSFFQVNTRQADRLITVVLDQLALRGDEVVADVYAGVGTFAALVAPRVASVYYIEESGPAFRDAQCNLANLTNVFLVAGRAEEQFARLPETPDVVILDPPRAGCHRALLEALKTAAPPTIAYVSCDPSTLARDLAILHDAGYAIGPVQPVDMFPHTFHIESVVVLRREAAAG